MPGNSAPLNFWVVKGRPAENNFDEWRIGEKEPWYTALPPKAWGKSDRIFFWRSSPKLDVIGLGEFLHVDPQRSGRKTCFWVKHSTRGFSDPVGVEELRNDPVVGGASFLKAGPAGTVFPITPEQGKRLYHFVCAHNPIASRVWPDLGVGDDTLVAVLDLDLLDVSGREGSPRLVTHLRRERDPKLVAAKKRAALSERGELACEVCKFDFARRYGQLGKNFCEVHHRRGLSQSGERMTTLEDLAIVCSNCHRMLHQGGDVRSIQQLRTILKRALKTANK